MLRCINLGSVLVFDPLPRNAHDASGTLWSYRGMQIRRRSDIDA